MGDPEIHALGFEFARQLRDPAFRKRLKDIGWTNEPVVPVEPTSTVQSILRRIDDRPDSTGAYLLAMRDEQAPLGWRFVWWGRADADDASGRRGGDRIEAYVQGMKAGPFIEDDVVPVADPIPDGQHRLADMTTLVDGEGFHE